jgi:hypothetical protein
MEIKNLGEFEGFLDKKTKQIGKLVATQARKLFQKKIEELNEAFLTSSDFKNIKTRLVGEYGFTPEEVQSLDNIVDAMTRVSNIDDSDGFVIQYVNLRALHNQPEAQHGLSSSSRAGEVVSWTEWLEEGVSITGHSYTAKPSPDSRSGKGIMSEGGAWALRPTRAFSNLSKKFGLKEAKEIMTLSVKRVKR